MAKINLNSAEIGKAISNIKSLTSELDGQLSRICSDIDAVKEVWSDNSGVYDYVSSTINTIRSVNSGYLEFSNDFVKVLQDVSGNYEKADQDLSAKVASAATMTLGAGAFSKFDFSKLTDRATKVATGEFIESDKVRKDVFTDADYTVNYLKDGTAVRLDKNGVPIYFTTKDNASILDNGSNASSSNASLDAAKLAEEARQQEIYKGLDMKDVYPKNSSLLHKDMLASLKPVKPDVLYTYDESGRASLTTLHPDVEVMKNQLIDECARQGLPVKVTETVRSVERQDSLYAQGRTAPGSKVTNAKGSSYSSNHQWGIAFDVCMADGDTWNEENLAKVGQIGKDLGLEWGGDWKMVDMPHFQLPNYGSGTKEIKAMYGSPDKFAETWYPDTDK